MNMLTNNNTPNIRYFALKVNGQIISRPVTDRSLLEKQLDLLPENQRPVSEIVVVTSDGRELLFG